MAMCPGTSVRDEADLQHSDGQAVKCLKTTSRMCIQPCCKAPSPVQRCKRCKSCTTAQTRTKSSMLHIHWQTVVHVNARQTRVLVSTTHTSRTDPTPSQLQADVSRQHTIMANQTALCTIVRLLRDRQSQAGHIMRTPCQLHVASVTQVHPDRKSSVRAQWMPGQPLSAPAGRPGGCWGQQPA